MASREADVRLDFRYMGFCPGATMIRAKLDLLAQEIRDYLPALAAKLGLSAPNQ